MRTSSGTSRSVQNLFDAVLWSNPELNPTSTDFGKVTGATNSIMRFFTFVWKVNFKIDRRTHTARDGTIVPGRFFTPTASIDDGLLHDGLEPLPDLVGVRRNALSHQHSYQFLAGINPEDRAGRAVPSVLSNIRRVAGGWIQHDLHVRQAPSHCCPSRLLHCLREAVPRHRLYRLRAQDAHAVELAFVEQHLAESDVVGYGRKQPDGALDERWPLSERQRLGVDLCEAASRRGAIHRSKPRAVLWRGRPEHRACHAERPENSLVEERLEWPA